MNAVEKPASERAKAIVEEIKKRTGTPCCELTIQAGSRPSLTDSKIGGLPYWDPAQPYPADPAGKKLILLAQLNFDQLRPDAPLPQSGLLQFFIGQDDLYGADFDAPDVQTGFRVVYHEHIDPSITPERVRALGVPTHADTEYTPVFHEAALEMERVSAYMGPEDCHFNPLFSRIVKELTGEDSRTAYGYLDTADYRYLYGQLSSTGHRMLGYPCFTQYDPRPEDSPYDTLLFQLDSDSEGREDYVLWGDCGVANFFINRDDLKKRDFSKVFYNWDCC